MEVVSHSSINHSKLIILVSTNSLSFVCKNSENNTFENLRKIRFENHQKTNKIEDLLVEVFNSNKELTKSYNDVLVLHSNNLSAFVPTELFDEDYLASYLQFNTKVFETDFFTFDSLVPHKINNVYIPYVNMNNFFIDHFGTFTYKHSSTILVAELLEISKKYSNKTMFVAVSEAHFEIVVAQNEHLLFYNSFEYQTPEDFIYYLLFTAEQLQLNTETFDLQLLGDISEDSTLFKIAHKYVRNTTLLECDISKNNFSDAEYRQHFILLNS